MKKITLLSLITIGALTLTSCALSQKQIQRLKTDFARVDEMDVQTVVKEFITTYKKFNIKLSKNNEEYQYGLQAGNYENKIIEDTEIKVDFINYKISKTIDRYNHISDPITGEERANYDLKGNGETYVENNTIIRYIKDEITSKEFKDVFEFQTNEEAKVAFLEEYTTYDQVTFKYIDFDLYYALKNIGLWSKMFSYTLIQSEGENYKSSIEFCKKRNLLGAKITHNEADGQYRNNSYEEIFNKGIFPLDHKLESELYDFDGKPLRISDESYLVKI